MCESLKIDTFFAAHNFELSLLFSPFSFSCYKGGLTTHNFGGGAGDDDGRQQQQKSC